MRVYLALLMRSHRRVPLAALACACLLVPAAIRAQVNGRVSSADGRPLAGAPVELWADGQLRAATTSHNDGAFVVRDTAGPTTGVLSLVVRSIGYRPATRVVTPDAKGVAIILMRLPALLEAVTVNAAAPAPRDPCARKPTADASRVFARAASFYRDDTRWLDRLARYVQQTRATRLADRELFLGVAQRGGWTRNSGQYDGKQASNSAAVPRRFTLADLRALPFPIPEPRLGGGWVFPRFWEWGSPSFVARAFVDSMPKAIVSRGAAGIVLSFCPKQRQLPYTFGEIQLAPDTTIVAVKWTFVVAKPDKESGGTALFGSPTSKSEKTHLLPTIAVTWTHVPGADTFETTEYAYGGWSVAEYGEKVRSIPPG